MSYNQQTRYCWKMTLDHLTAGHGTAWGPCQSPTDSQCLVLIRSWPASDCPSSDTSLTRPLTSLQPETEVQTLLLASGIQYTGWQTSLQCTECPVCSGYKASVLLPPKRDNEMMTLDGWQGLPELVFFASWTLTSMPRFNGTEIKLEYLWLAILVYVISWWWQKLASEEGMVSRA